MSRFVINYHLPCNYMSCGLGLIRYAALYVVAALEIQSPSPPPPCPSIQVNQTASPATTTISVTVSCEAQDLPCRLSWNGCEAEALHEEEAHFIHFTHLKHVISASQR